MALGDDRAGDAQGETAPEIQRVARCRPGEHRCVALMLGFFDIEATGEIGAMTSAAALRCEASVDGIGL